MLVYELKKRTSQQILNSNKILLVGVVQYIFAFIHSVEVN